MINIVTVQLACVVFHLSISEATDNKCPLNMTLFTLPDGSQDCDMCRICPHGLIEEEPCGYRKDPVCICKDGSYRDHLYNCWPCSSCQKDQYIKAPCSRTEDIVCGNCTHCGDRGEITRCNATSDTVCSDAGGGTKIIVILAVTSVVVAIFTVILTYTIFILWRRRKHQRKDILDDTEIEELNEEANNKEKELGSKKKDKRKRNMTVDPHAGGDRNLEFINCVIDNSNSVGAIVHGDRVITAFRVGPSYVMTAYSTVKDLIKSDYGCFEITFDECPTSKNKHKLLRYPLFKDEDVDVAVFSIQKPSIDLPDPVSLLFIQRQFEKQKLEFVSYMKETNSQRLHVRYNEILVEGTTSYENALKRIRDLQDSILNALTSPSKKRKSGHLLDKSLKEFKGESMYVWKSTSHKLSSPGAPGFTQDGNKVGVVCMFTHEWPWRDEVIQQKLTADADWFAGPSMTTIYEKIKATDKDLADKIFTSDSDDTYDDNI